MDKFIDFSFKDGKFSITKFAKYLGVPQSTLSSRQITNKREFDLLLLGAICEANGVTKEDLERLVREK